MKFLSIIHDVLNVPQSEFVKQTTDEVEIRGSESKYDSRRLNSYPSKVGGYNFPQLRAVISYFFATTIFSVIRFWKFFSIPRSTSARSMLFYNLINFIYYKKYVPEL